MERLFYDPKKSYEENFEKGPFGGFAKGEPLVREGEPEVELWGERVYAPFGVPAGPLINGRFVEAAFERGFDVCVYKTVRTRAYPCHPWPNVLGVKIEGKLTPEKAMGELVAGDEYGEPLSITNSFGVPSMDVDWWQEDMRRAARSVGRGQLLVGSFQGTKKEGGTVGDFVDDYVLGARLVAQTGVKVLEANLSCPNEGTAELLCFDTNRVVEITGKIKDEVGNLPLVIKLAYFEDGEHLRKFVREVGRIVDGFSAINTIAARIVDERGKQALPGEGRARSGVCGAAIKWAGLEMAGRLRDLRDELGMEYVIVGVGGVTEARDYLEYRGAGADVVMSATGAMWRPSLGKGVWGAVRNGPSE